MPTHPLPTMYLILILCFGLVVLILYLLTLQKVLRKCAPASRTMEPGKVWLTLIPAFGLVWHFIVVLNMAKSLGNEFESRGIPCPEQAPGQTVGLANCVCSCCTFIPLLGGLAGLIGLVLWIIYWARIAEFSRLLEAHQGATAALPTV